MNEALANAWFAAFLLFCRVGGTIALTPGFSSARVPPVVRLWLAMAISLALTPLVWAEIVAAIPANDGRTSAFLVVSESSIGLTLGLLTRFFILALQFAASVAASSIGLAGIPGVPIEEHEAGGPLSSLASMGAVLLLLSLNLHVETVQAVVDSYGVLAPGMVMDSSMLSTKVVDTLAEATVLAARIAAPFVLYGIVVNVGLGLANRFAPQISFFQSMSGAVLIGGVFLLYVLWPKWISLFASSYSDWIAGGGL